RNSEKVESKSTERRETEAEFELRSSIIKMKLPFIRLSSTIEPSSLLHPFASKIDGFGLQIPTRSTAKPSHVRPFSIQCSVRFRPCIDIHKGKVKQIVGSTLSDSKEGGSSSSAALVTNFESDKPSAEYARLYKDDGLFGGHVIMLGADPLSRNAAVEALHAFPGGLQVGGGINSDNALSYIEEGASHVIVTSELEDKVALVVVSCDYRKLR
ncbi:hypothetical protein SOVF_204760, partial [Spinacia oleracea]